MSVISCELWVVGCGLKIQTSLLVHAGLAEFNAEDTERCDSKV